MDAIPIAASSYRISKESMDLRKPSLDVEIGMRTRVEDVDFLKIERKGKNIALFEEQTCVYGIIQSDDGEILTEERIHHVLDYIEECGLAVSGDAYTEIIAVENRGGRHLRYDRLFVPVVRCYNEEHPCGRISEHRRGTLNKRPFAVIYMPH